MTATATRRPAFWPYSSPVIDVYGISRGATPRCFAVKLTRSGDAVESTPSAFSGKEAVPPTYIALSPSTASNPADEAKTTTATKATITRVTGTRMSPPGDKESCDGVRRQWELSSIPDLLPRTIVKLVNHRHV